MDGDIVCVIESGAGRGGSDGGVIEFNLKGLRGQFPKPGCDFGGLVFPNQRAGGVAGIDDGRRVRGEKPSAASR